MDLGQLFLERVKRKSEREVGMNAKEQIKIKRGETRVRRETFHLEEKYSLSIS